LAFRNRIEWTQATWNPVTGCTKVSQGCKHCYAERLDRRPDDLRRPCARAVSRRLTSSDEMLAAKLEGVALGGADPVYQDFARFFSCQND
jgi:protein gp37